MGSFPPKTLYESIKCHKYGYLFTSLYGQIAQLVRALCFFFYQNVLHVH